MTMSVISWCGLVSVIIIGLFGFTVYFNIFMILTSFVAGLMTVLYFTYDEKNIFSSNLNILDDPLQQTRFLAPLPKVLELFQKKKVLPKFDNRITGSETVDTFLNEIIMIIINDYVTPWYEMLTDDDELTKYSIKPLVIAAGANITNRIKLVDWIHLLSTRFPEELTTHIKLFKQSRVRLKTLQPSGARYDYNAYSKPSPKRHDEKKMHRRNKSETDLSCSSDTQIYGNSKFYGSSENIPDKSLKDIFFDLECSMENKHMCRDIFCMDSDREKALLSEMSEAVLYLVAPEEAWKCDPLKQILLSLLTSVVLKPLVDLLSDPDVINRTIVRYCSRDSSLPSDLFLMVIRCCGDIEELDATLEFVKKDIQKLHSRDSAGEWELTDRQKLSSLEYVMRIIDARKATIGPQMGTSNCAEKSMSEEVERSLRFLREISHWKSNAQYLLEIEISKTDSSYTSKAVLDNLRSSALEICDTYLAPNRPSVMGILENFHSEMVTKITTEGEDFSNNPVTCFDDVQKCVYDALEDNPSWQADFMMDDPDATDRSNSYYTNDKSEAKKYAGYTLTVPGARHNRSRSDIVGNSQNMISESAGPSNLTSAHTSNLSMSHSDISRNAKNLSSPLTASIIETALVQQKGKAFGIYAIAVTRLSNKEKWHIYRRYSDFHDLHSSIKEKWPELSALSFPAKKTFQNKSRSVLESRKRILNAYLENLTMLARETKYVALMSQEYLGGFLNPETQAERQSVSIDAFIGNSLKAGIRTLKNMPDQFANTVDGVMDGISKVFQGKNEDYCDGIKAGSLSDTQDDNDESVALRLLEEVLGIRGLWLRRRLLAPLRTMIADRVNRKVFELVTSLTSPRNVVQYLKTFKQWLTTHEDNNQTERDANTKARTRVAAKVALLSSCSDDLKHIVGTDQARRGLLTVFDLCQTQEINKRLILVLLEDILINLFPENHIQDFFKKIYSNSPRVPVPKKSVNI